MSELSSTVYTHKIHVRIGDKKNFTIKSYNLTREEAVEAQKQLNAWRFVLIPPMGQSVNPDKIDSIERIQNKKHEVHVVQIEEGRTPEQEAKIKLCINNLRQKYGTR